MFFASDSLIDALKAAGATGLYAEQIQHSDGGQLTGPEYRPEHHIFWLGSFGHAVASKALDGNLEKVTLAHALPEEYYWLRGGWRPALALGVPVLPDNVPTRWYYGSKERVLPGFWAHGGVLTVSAAFREIIENLEPNQHQFFPVDFVTKKGELIEKRFILVITRIVDALDRARSGPNPSILWHTPIGYMRERIIDADKVSDIHLWLDHYYGHNNNCFVSYELARRFEKANPKNIRFSALRLNTA